MKLIYAPETGRVLSLLEKASLGAQVYTVPNTSIHRQIGLQLDVRHAFKSVTSLPVVLLDVRETGQRVVANFFDRRPTYVVGTVSVRQTASIHRTFRGLQRARSWDFSCNQIQENLQSW